MEVVQVAVVLFFIMFIYSGINKILNFGDKVAMLGKKTGLPRIINVLGMVGVIGLELIGSLLLILYFMEIKFVTANLAKFVAFMYLLFLVVVTMLYHPPWDKLIPFLSNVTTFAGLLLIYERIH